MTNTGATWQLDASFISTTDNITCVASATDSDGATVSSNPYVVTLNNSAPTVSNVSIVPNTSVTTGTTLSCLANGSDPDDGLLTPTYEWSVNGSVIGSQSTYVVSASDTNVGDVIQCTATVVDSEDSRFNSECHPSKLCTFLRATMVAAVSSGTETLTCMASGVDPDGDSVR